MVISKSENIFKKIVYTPGFRNIVRTHIALRCTELFHHTTYAMRNERMAQAIERFKGCENKKPDSQIKYEMNLCQKYWGCYPSYYFMYNLYRSDKKLSEHELLNYIPEFFFYYLYLPVYNNIEFEHLIRDKNLTEQLLRDLNIPQADTICKLIHNRIYTNKLVEIDFNIVKRQLLEKEYKKIFVKPTRGEGGHGIYIFNLNEGKYLTKDDLEFNEDFLKKIGKSSDYIVQPGLEQTEELAQIYPSSVNTFRIATENKDGRVRILCAILRFGRNNTQVDNSDQGGLFVTVDVESGKLGKFATSMIGEQYEKHPDTKFCFAENKMLEWNEIKAFIEICARNLTQFTYLGWDIAITNQGPIVIEVNYGFSLDGLQIIFGGLREILRINNPEEYWENKGWRT